MDVDSSFEPRTNSFRSDSENLGANFDLDSGDNLSIDGSDDENDFSKEIPVG